MDDKRKVIGFVTPDGFRCVEHAVSGGGEMVPVMAGPNPVDAPKCRPCHEGRGAADDVPQAP